MLIPAALTSDTVIGFISSYPRRLSLLYIILSLGIIGVIILLPYIYTDISVTSQGIIRPATERTEIKPVVSGIIDTIYYKEGEIIPQNAVLLRIKDPDTKSKKILNNFEISQREKFIHDIGLLTQTDNLNEQILQQLQSPLYKEQVSRFIHRKTDQEAALRKADKEVEMNTSLANDKVISPKEFFDIRNNQERTEAACKAFVREQLSYWQQDMARYQLELSQYRQQLEQLNTEAGYFEIKAPVGGTVQGITTRYAGGLLQANESICSISPDGSLIAECMVTTKDVGLVKRGQEVRYQVDAFDYNYFGVLTGKVISIDNDYTVMDNLPAFKVRCSFDSTQLYLKNGFTGKLKKGLTFQARFIVARRSLWQLLWDKLDNWLNPTAPRQ